MEIMTAVKVMILTKNEEAAIRSLIDETRACMGSWDYQLFLVDDSSDRTAFLAREKGCEVVENGGLGLGRAYLRALRKAGESPCSYVVTMDGDGQADPREIPRFLQVAREKKADLVLGSRFLERGLIDYSYPIINRIGVFLLARFLSFECRMKITDSHGGLRVHSPECARRLRVRGSHTYVQESIIDASKKKFRIVEIPSRWRERVQGRSRVVSSIFRYVNRVLPVLILRTRRIYLWVLFFAFGGFAWALSGG